MLNFTIDYNFGNHNLYTNNKNNHIPMVKVSCFLFGIIAILLWGLFSLFLTCLDYYSMYFVIFHNYLISAIGILNITILCILFYMFKTLSKHLNYYFWIFSILMIKSKNYNTRHIFDTNQRVLL